MTLVRIVTVVTVRTVVTVVIKHLFTIFFVTKRTLTKKLVLQKLFTNKLFTLKLFFLSKIFLMEPKNSAKNYLHQTDFFNMKKIQKKVFHQNKHSKTQNFTKLDNSNCDKTQKIKL